MVLHSTELSTPASAQSGADSGGSPLPGGIDHSDSRAPAPRNAGLLRSTLGYIWHNPRLMSGLMILLGLVLFWLVGSRLVDVKGARPLSAPPDMEPSSEYWLGSDSAGRQLLPVLIEATP